MGRVGCGRTVSQFIREVVKAFDVVDMGMLPDAFNFLIDTLYNL